MKSEKMGENYHVFLSDDGSYQFAICDMTDRHDPIISITSSISLRDLHELIRLLDQNKSKI